MKKFKNNSKVSGSNSLCLVVDAILIVVLLLNCGTDLDTSHSHQLLRLKGQSGPAVIHRYVVGQGYQRYEYNNEDYIQQYEERKAKLLEKKDAHFAAKAEAEKSAKEQAEFV